MFACVVLVTATTAYWLMSTDVHVIEKLIASRIDLDDITGGGGRLEIWKHLLPLAPEALIFPNGYYSSLYIFHISPHNYLINVSLEQGILGW